MSLTSESILQEKNLNIVKLGIVDYGQAHRLQEQLVKAQIQLTAQQVEVAKSEMETNRMEAIWKHEENMLKIKTTDETNRYKIELEYQHNVPQGLSSV